MKFSRSTLLGVFLTVSAATASAPLAFADTLSLGSFATGTNAASLGFTNRQTARTYNCYTASVPTTLSHGPADTFTLSPNGIWSSIAGSNSTWIGIADGGPQGFGRALREHGEGIGVETARRAKRFCADNGINCRTTTVIPISVIGTGDPSGMNFAANLAVAVNPEPSSFILLGTGMLSAAGLYLRRRAASV